VISLYAGNSRSEGMVPEWEYALELTDLCASPAGESQRRQRRPRVVKDPSGKQVFPNPAGFCGAAKKHSGIWTEYWWPKPGEKESSRKISYH
jgi:hypothetical protein